MMLRLKVWPTPELAKQVFIVDGKVLQVRYVDLDLRSFAGVANLTEYGRKLLWEDFFASDPHAWDRRSEITTANIGAWDEDKVVLQEWVSHLFTQSISDLNREWASARVDPAELQARAHQAELDRLAMEWHPEVVQLADPVQADDPGF
jgi:hypothetical protein